MKVFDEVFTARQKEEKTQDSIVSFPKSTLDYLKDFLYEIRSLFLCSDGVLSFMNDSESDGIW